MALDMSNSTQERDIYERASGSSLVTVHSDMWQNQSFCKFVEFRNQKRLCDVVLITSDDHAVFAHSLLLAAASPYFMSILTKTSTSEMVSIILKETPRSVLEMILTFVYSGQVDISVAELAHVATSAKMLQMSALYEKCANLYEQTRQHGTALQTSHSNNSLVCIKTEILEEKHEKNHETKSPRTQLKPRRLVPVAPRVNTRAIPPVRDHREPASHTEMRLTEDEEARSNKQDRIYIKEEKSDAEEECERTPQMVDFDSTASSLADHDDVIVCEPNNSVQSHPTNERTQSIQPYEWVSSNYDMSIQNQFTITPPSIPITQSSIKSQPHFGINRFKSLSAGSNARRGHRSMFPSPKRYMCTYCGKGFAQSAGLRIHIRLHTGEKPFECNFCGKRFADYSNLKQHRLIHTGEKPYGCGLCGKRFTRNGTLKMHIQNIHFNQLPSLASANLLSQSSPEEH